MAPPTKRQISPRVQFIIGMVAGATLPALTIYIFLTQALPREQITLETVLLPQILSPSLSIGALINLPTLYLCIRYKLFFMARGIFATTFLLAFYIIYLKL